MEKPHTKFKIQLGAPVSCEQSENNERFLAEEVWR